MQLIAEQLLNGLQFGLMLFLLAAGLTLVFGIMDLMNLAHGSLYMIGAYLMATIAAASGSFWIALPLAIVLTAAVGLALERLLIRHLYHRDHLAQVLATFALILIANDLVKLIWGSAPLMLNAPASLSGPVELVPGFYYPAYRLLIIGVGLASALLLYILVAHTKTGMLLRAGAVEPRDGRRRWASTSAACSPRCLRSALHFAQWLARCSGQCWPSQVGMGESILILAFVVIVIGGIGSMRGALVGALLVGLVDTAGRAFLPSLLNAVMPLNLAANLGPALAAIAIYLLMAAVLFLKPSGLFPARG
ncbi:MAG: branched-chain amino acid ABC transporter permease [Burkholderiaceae bacterium]|nr:branched-chain amino acid ABC transporter permease [Burkholderiaceae bacterium]